MAALDAVNHIVNSGTSVKCGGAFLHRVIDCLVQQLPFSTLCTEFEFSADCPNEISITSLAVAACKAFRAAGDASTKTNSESLDGLPQIYAEVFDARLADLQHVGKQAAISQGGGMLTDFDWSLRLTVSSQSAAAVRDPKVLLSLRSSALGSSGTAQTHLLELSSEALDNAVQELERAAQVMQQSESS